MPELPTLKAVNSSARVKAAGSTWKDLMALGNSIDLIVHFHMQRHKGQQSKLIWKKSELQSDFLHMWETSSGDDKYVHS